MKEKSAHLKKTFDNSQNSKTFVFAYIKSCKARTREKIFNNLRKKRFFVVNLPSAFKLEKKINLQGPCIIIMHSEIFSVKLFIYLKKFKDNLEFLSFKYKNSKSTYYYSPVLIDNAIFLKCGFDFCIALIKSLNMPPLRVLILIQNKQIQ